MLAITIYMPQGGLPWEIAVLLYDKCGFVLPNKFSIELVIYTTYTPKNTSLQISLRCRCSLMLIVDKVAL